MRKSSAVLRATAAVGLIGAIGGALGGVLVGALFLVLVPFRQHGLFVPNLGEVLEMLAATSAYGAAYGVVLGPALGWALMRQVPLGTAIGQTAFAAALGVGAAFAFPVSVAMFFVNPVVFAIAAALRLRHRCRLRAPATVSEEGAS